MCFPIFAIIQTFYDCCVNDEKDFSEEECVPKSEPATIDEGNCKEPCNGDDTTVSTCCSGTSVSSDDNNDDGNDNERHLQKTIIAVNRSRQLLSARKKKKYPNVDAAFFSASTSHNQGKITKEECLREKQQRKTSGTVCFNSFFLWVLCIKGALFSI